MNTSWSGDRRSFPKATREKILRRAHYTCQLNYAGCLRRATQADHIVPRAEGGTDHDSNGQATCAACHNTKTRNEQARGRARTPARQRPTEPHPGLVT
jgi:5-methylcytosine-specific restriction endonuclease McrA